MTQKFHDMERIAVFPGSFDPFTIGHSSILERGLGLFDKIIIAIGYNEHKQSSNSLNDRIEAISRLYADNPMVEVMSYSGLTIEFAKKHGAKFILRGARSYSDFEYERNLADVNRKISGIETVILFTLPEHSYVSSSMVRELQHNNYDVADFIP